jgi:hypothetical protein
VIASLLVVLWTERKPTKRTWEMLQLYLLGWASVEEVTEHLAHRARPPAGQRRGEVCAAAPRGEGARRARPVPVSSGPHEPAPLRVNCHRRASIAHLTPFSNNRAEHYCPAG